MKNDQLENPKIDESKLENAAGGLRMHVSTSGPTPAKIDALYLSKDEFNALNDAGLISKNNTISESNMRNIFPILFSDCDNTEKTFSSRVKLTAGNKRKNETKVKIIS